MSELFKEVKSQNPANENESTAAAAAAENTEKESSEKGKHGDPGVCCGGCS